MEALTRQTHTHVTRVSSRFLHLAVFGACPKHQGQGYGRCCLTRLLAVADEKGIPCSLETCTDSNKLNYWHYGFDMVGEEIWAPGCSESWISMVRPVRAPKREKGGRPGWLAS